MTKREYGYYIAQSPDQEGLAKLVLSKMKDGYTVAGGVCVVPITAGWGYIQALVLDRVSESENDGPTQAEFYGSTLALVVQAATRGEAISGQGRWPVITFIEPKGEERQRAIRVCRANAHWTLRHASLSRRRNPENSGPNSKMK